MMVDIEIEYCSDAVRGSFGISSFGDFELVERATLPDCHTACAPLQKLNDAKDNAVFFPDTTTEKTSLV